MQSHGFSLGAAQEKFTGRSRPIGPWSGGFHAQMAGEIAAKVAIIRVDAGMGAVPRSDGALLQAEGRVGDDPGRVRSKADAKAGAFRASAFGAVEGEVARSEPRGAIAGLWILGFGRKSKIGLSRWLRKVGRGERNHEAALAESESQFNGVGQAGPAGFLDLKAIDDQFHGLLVRGQGEIDPLAFAAGAEKTLFF